MQAFVSYWEVFLWFWRFIKRGFGGCIIECFDSKGEFLNFFGACVIFSCYVIFHKTTVGLFISTFTGFSYV